MWRGRVLGWQTGVWALLISIPALPLGSDRGSMIQEDDTVVRQVILVLAPHISLP